MTNILVFGAGKSSSYLIRYLLENASRYFWQVTVADADLNAALARVHEHSFGTAVQLEIHEEDRRMRQIAQADLVISLLPPALHYVVALDCLRQKKSLVTASYLSPEIKTLHVEARNAGLLFMNEIGLDPGIDHMSAMKIIDEVARMGADIYSFKSYCGGLVAPESDTNPWHYKISWNSNNILHAGKQGAHYLQDGKEVRIEYPQLFAAFERIDVPTLGTLAAYANRDSLTYKEFYGLQQVRTMLRATLRYEEFCIGWDVIVKLGLTGDQIVDLKAPVTYYRWFMEATAHLDGHTPEERITNLCKAGSGLALELIRWLGLFSDEVIAQTGPYTHDTILLARLEEKWKMKSSDRDMVVMQHEFEYARKTIKTKLTSTLIVKGEDKTYTAMAKTVGLPMGIFVKLFLIGKIKNLFGVQIPIIKDVYKPVLKELAGYGIEFMESYQD